MIEQNSGISFLPMQAGHIRAVIELEQMCHLDSRSQESYSKLLQDEKSVLIVALKTDTTAVSPYVIAVFSGWVAADELQIDNIAVAESWRKKGVGKEILAEAMRKASKKGAVCVFLEVRANNQPARMFYERIGFTLIGRRKSYYQDPPDEALIMRMEMPAGI